MPTAPTRCVPVPQTAAPPPASPSKWRRPIRRATSPPALGAGASRSRLGQRRRHAHTYDRDADILSLAPGGRSVLDGLDFGDVPDSRLSHDGNLTARRRGADLPARLHRRHPWQPAPEQQRRALAASGELDRCAVSRHQLQWTDRRRHGYADSIRTGLRSGRRPEPVAWCTSSSFRHAATGHRTSRCARGTDCQCCRAGAQRRHTREDRTTVAQSGALELVKEVPHRPTAAPPGRLGQQQSGASGDWLQYRITYRNKNIDPLRNLVITDATPAFTATSTQPAAPARLTASPARRPAPAAIPIRAGRRRHPAVGVPGQARRDGRPAERRSRQRGFLHPAGTLRRRSRAWLPDARCPPCRHCPATRNKNAILFPGWRSLPGRRRMKDAEPQRSSGSLPLASCQVFHSCQPTSAPAATFQQAKALASTHEHGGQRRADQWITARQADGLQGPA